MTGAVNAAASILGQVSYNSGAIRIEVREQRGIGRRPKGSGELSAPAVHSTRLRVISGQYSFGQSSLASVRLDPPYTG